MNNIATSVLAKDENTAVPPALRAKLEAHGILPLWEADDSLLRGGPTEPGRVWRWADLEPIIEEASMIVNPSIVERRVLQLRNGDIKSSFSATSGLINATVQSTRPGESARPHRHTMNALRFVLNGATGETVVDGKPCLMTPGDLIVTPAWTWHGHRNQGTQHTMWLDILDVALHVSLGAAKFQAGPVNESIEAFEDRLFAVAGIVPVLPSATSLPHSPKYRYPWSDAIEALGNAPASDDGSKMVRYVNPLTGGPVMSLIDCFAIELADGQETGPIRSSAHAICTVVEGSGTTRIEGASKQTLEWTRRDLFNVPQHSWVSYRATGGSARLFMASNREAFRRLGLLLEERRGA